MDAKLSLGEPRLLISRDALIHNAALLRSRLPAGTKLCAVLKADAYGHGADLVVDALYNFSTDAMEGPFIDAIAVATVDEAELLPGGTHLPIYVFRPVENAFLASQRSKIETAIRNNWVLTLCHAAAASDVARIATALGKRAAVQVMVDTGMTRAGADLGDVPRLIEAITTHAALKLVAVGTHFSEAERVDSATTAVQTTRFRDATDGPLWQLAARFKTKVLRHAANSGGIFFHAASHLDMVRPGLSLYGLDPTFAPSLDRPLRPVLKWTAPLIGIREVTKGTAVGYGRTWVAPRDTKIGLVPVGYADGYLRAFSNKAQMLVHERPVPVVGVVSMDSTTIDLGPDAHATLGDEVTILDDNPLSPVSAYALARWAETIPYEIFCRIGPRVKRVTREVEADDMAIK